MTWRVGGVIPGQVRKPAGDSIQRESKGKGNRAATGGLMAGRQSD